MSKSKQKGSSLEYAVFQIEELILRQDPSLHNSTARIQRNRWFNISGVTFEVDVLVTTGDEQAPQYHVRADSLSQCHVTARVLHSPLKVLGSTLERAAVRLGAAE